MSFVLFCFVFPTFYGRLTVTGIGRRPKLSILRVPMEDKYTIPDRTRGRAEEISFLRPLPPGPTSWDLSLSGVPPLFLPSCY